LVHLVLDEKLCSGFEVDVQGQFLRQYNSKYEEGIRCRLLNIAHPVPVRNYRSRKAKD